MASDCEFYALVLLVQVAEYREKDLVLLVAGTQVRADVRTVYIVMALRVSSPFRLRRIDPHKRVVFQKV